MGRPALNLEAIVVRLPKGMAERIDALTGGGNKRAAFIREAVEKELKRREKAKERE